jgi:hypothetical protein
LNENKNRKRKLDRDKAKELLKDPDLLTKIQSILDKKIVGDSSVKTLVFLISLSSRMKDDKVALGAILSGQSSVGKSWIIQNVTKYFPKKDVLFLTRLSSAALNRLKEDLTGKILVIAETTGGINNSQIRPMLSEHKLVLLTSEKDAKQNWITKKIVREGCPALLTTTTSHITDLELETRVFKLGLDTSQQQTKKILEQQAKQSANPLYEDWDKDDKMLKKALHLLQPIKIVIPFASSIAKLFPKNKIRARRDFPKFLTLVKVIAFLHQKQRIKVKDKNFILADIQDLKYTCKIIPKILMETSTGMTREILDFYDFVKENYGLGNPVTTVLLDEDEKIVISQDTIRKYLKTLVRLGYCTENWARRPYTYTLKKVETSGNWLNQLENLSFSEEDLKKWLDSYGIEVD